MTPLPKFNERLREIGEWRDTLETAETVADLTFLLEAVRLLRDSVAFYAHEVWDDNGTTDKGDDDYGSWARKSLEQLERLA